MIIRHAVNVSAVNMSEKMKVTFELVRPARGGGGDRYVAEVNGEEWTVYFKQSISRPNGEDIKETITVEISY